MAEDDAAQTSPSGRVPRRRGRPTPDEAAAISRNIVAAATAVFLAEGYERASMEAVAARAGVPKPTLYKRYPDKKALLRAVVRERLSTWAFAERDDGLGGDLETRLKDLAAAMLVRAMSPEIRVFLDLVASAWSGPGEAAHRQEVIGYTAMVDRLAHEIDDYAHQQGVPARQPRRAAVALMAMLTGWIAHEAPAAERVEAEAVAFAHAAVELLLRGSMAW